MSKNVQVREWLPIIVYLLAIDILQRKDQFQPKAQATSLTISNTSARLNLAIFLVWPMD